MVSNRGYGFLWNSPAVGRVELADNGTRWVADSARQVDYWVTAGDKPGGYPLALRRRHRARTRAAFLGKRLLAEQAPLPDPGGALGRGPRSTTAEGSRWR